MGGDSLISALRDTTLEDRESDGPPPQDEFAGSTAVSPALALDLGPPIRPAEVKAGRAVGAVVRIVEVDRPVKDASYILPLVTPSGPPAVVLVVPSSRSRPKGYIEALDALREYVLVQHQEGTILLSPGHEDELETALKQHQSPPPDGSIQMTKIEDARHLSTAQLQAAKKLILPIAVALLCAVPALGEELEEDEELDKIVVADALHKLVALWPDGNPPRAALKRVNEFLMSEHRR